MKKTNDGKGKGPSTSDHDDDDDDDDDDTRQPSSTSSEEWLVAEMADLQLGGKAVQRKGKFFVLMDKEEQVVRQSARLSPSDPVGRFPVTEGQASGGGGGGGGGQVLRSSRLATLLQQAGHVFEQQKGRFLVTRTVHRSRNQHPPPPPPPPRRPKRNTDNQEGTSGGSESKKARKGEDPN